jgi:hypothetical protein
MKKFTLLVFFIISITVVYGQDSLKSEKPVLSGYADVYYQYNFNDNATDNKTSFTNSQNSFELGMISLKVQHAFGKVSFLGDIGFGKRAEEFSYNDKKTSVAIKQLYMSYAPVDWVKFSIGSFATHVGYELVDANMNRNYSMSYMFSYGPFFHTGIKANFTAGTNTFMIGVFNPTDYKYAPLNSKKYIGAQWGFSPAESSFSSYLNYIGGKDTAGVRNDQLDLVMNYKVSSHFSLGYNGTYSRYSMPDDSKAGWWGSALYLNADFTDAFGLTLRTEYFDDKDNLKVFTDKDAFPRGGHVWSFTLSGNYRVKALTIIPEVRLDYASGQLFTKNSSGTRTSPDILVAAVYSF